MNRRKKDRVIAVIEALVIFVVIFMITFIIANILIIGPEESLKKIKTYGQALVGKLDTEVDIEDNTIEETPAAEVAKNLEEGEVEAAIPIEIEPLSPEEMPQFNQQKFEEATKLYSEEEVHGLSDTWYYNQLDETGQLIYRKLKSESGFFLEGQHKFDFGHAFNDLLNSPGGQETLENAFQQSVNALMFDFPQLFFIDIRNITIFIQKTTYYSNKHVYSVSISNAQGKTFFTEGINSKEEAQRAMSEMESIRYLVMEKVSNPTDPYEVALTAHDYLIDTVEYDKTLRRENIYNMYGALKNRFAVCEGYAKAYKYLLDYYGITNIIVAGTGYNDNGESERHAWNYVYIDGQWYGVDTTWNDPVVPPGTIVRNETRYRYFLAGGDEFLRHHDPNGEIVDGFQFSYPALSRYNYFR